MVEKSFSLLFYLKKPKKYLGGAVPVYVRITVNGLPKELSLKRKWEPGRWNSFAGRASGTKDDAKALNAYLDIMQSKVYEVQRCLLASNQVPSANEIKNKLLGRKDANQMLLEIFEEHNNQMKKLIVKEEYAPGTLTHFTTTLSHIKNYIYRKFGLNDISIDRIDFGFLHDFEFYLKSERCAHNTAMKYMGDLKKIILLCVKRHRLVKDPFLGYNLSRRDVEKEFLVDEEIQALVEKKFLSERLTVVKDIFLFSCFTGLAYADVKKLKKSEIRSGIDGKKWLFIQRQKTSTPAPVPLLPVALAILDKYKAHPKCIDSNKVLPILSNQKMNEYLKEIADLCGIQKELTYHTARHTFGTTITLNNNVPIESVSKMMGHKNLKTTQHYAKILNKKVSEDMAALSQKLYIQNGKTLGKDN